MYVQFASKIVDFRLCLADTIQLHKRTPARQGDLGEQHKPLLQPGVTL